jgi:hypothetical protein
MSDYNVLNKQLKEDICPGLPDLLQCKWSFPTLLLRLAFPWGPVGMKAPKNPKCNPFQALICLNLQRVQSLLPDANGQILNWLLEHALFRGMQVDSILCVVFKAPGMADK